MIRVDPNLIADSRICGIGNVYRMCSKCMHIMKDKIYTANKHLHVNGEDYVLESDNEYYTSDYVHTGVCPECNNDKFIINDAAMSEAVAILLKKGYFVVTEFSGSYYDTDYADPFIAIIINDKCKAESFIKTLNTLMGKIDFTIVDENNNTVRHEKVYLFDGEYQKVSELDSEQAIKALSCFKDKYFMMIAPTIPDADCDYGRSSRFYKMRTAYMIMQLTTALQYMPEHKFTE